MSFYAWAAVDASDGDRLSFIEHTRYRVINRLNQGITPRRTLKQLREAGWSIRKIHCFFVRPRVNLPNELHQQ